MPPLPTHKKIKVLIIDDDLFILDMYVLKFKNEGFEFDTAENGQIGLEKIRSFKPDAVLLDIVMPEIDGFEVLKNLNEEAKGSKLPFKVIFLTNFGEREDIKKGLMLGADGYIIKAHFTPQEVVSKVKEILEITS